jgi:hypothetical protein
MAWSVVRSAVWPIRLLRNLLVKLFTRLPKETVREACVRD